MLTFRNTNIALALVLLGFLVGQAPWWAYLVVVFGYSLVVFYGVYFIQSGFFMPTIYRAKHPRQSIALTFDDGPSPEYTPRVLDILNAHGLTAAFFCIGKNIAGNEALLRRMADEGHLIGNHSFTHNAWFDIFSVKKMLAELRDTDRAIESVIGKRPLWFRPPYGVINPNVRDAVRQSRHYVIGWNMRSYDTMISDNQTLMRRLMRLLQPGAIVLLHDHGKQTIEVLPEFIRAVQENGYQIEPLDQLIDVRAYA